MSDPLPEPIPEIIERGNRRRIAPVLVSVLAAMLVLGGLLAVPVLLGDGESEGSASGDVTLAAVQTFELGPPKHVSGRIAYAQSPPVGGDHNRVWLACGRHPESIRNEFAVHNLEHGGVWIAYDPELSSADVSSLAKSLPADGILTPYEGLGSPVVVTVWGAQLQLDGADDKRLALFIAEYGDGGTAPEPDASCDGGVGSPVESGLDV